MRLTASSVADRDIDARPPGLSLGDSLVATADLLRSGTEVGRGTPRARAPASNPSEAGRGSPRCNAWPPCGRRKRR